MCCDDIHTAVEAPTMQARVHIKTRLMCEMVWSNRGTNP